MRWLIAQLLWIPKVAAGLLTFYGVYLFFAVGTSESTEDAIFLVGFGLALVWACDVGQTKLLRRRPRLMKMRLPKREKKQASQEPQKPAERVFAEVPMVEPVKAKTRSQRSSMDPKMRKFIEGGAKAIRKTQR